MSEQTQQPPSTTAPGLGRTVAAWAVHALTISGLVWATLALQALLNDDIALMWLWFVIALIVDGVDGTLARKVGVREVIPWFDGAVVDNLVDYLTWTFLPALFMSMALPFGPAPVPLLMMILIIVSSVFCYANDGEKSNDNYFVGFPAAWNIVAVMVWVLQTPAWINIAATILMTILTLVPTHYVHPVRVKRFRALNVTAVGVWIAATAWLLVVHPVRPQVATVLSVGSGLWLVGVGVLRSVQGEAPQSPQSSQSSEASAKP